mmetsp:Transcript_61557/g.169183  ORF Transcript_61557/g.169183 Transcript_61557/m.169183 type:complete len:618 (+) Transcript_61557:563-2416(+)
MKTVPYPIFYLRYSLFMVLYPAGITGEVFQMITSMSYWQESVPMWYRALILILVVYVPGSPGMVLNMWGNRKGAMKKRAQAANPRPEKGLVWPDKSTTKTNKAIFQASVETEAPAAAKKVKKEKNWRWGYVKHVEGNVRASLASPKAALGVADAGLKAAHDLFLFARDGNKMKFSEAMATMKGTFKTGTLRGEKKLEKKKLEVPYGGKVGKPYYKFKKARNDKIGGAELKEQLKTWVDYGVIEADCAKALSDVCDNPEWLDLSEHYFVLLGATSAMGPLPLLLSLGANIIAIDIDRESAWSKIFEMVRDSPGTVTFPIKGDVPEGKSLKDLSDAELAKISGCNLLEDTPEIANWLCEICPEKNLTIGNYTYLDGALHVQLSLACDAIISKLADKRPDLAIAFLCTPTDTHTITKEAYEAIGAAEKVAPLWQKLSPMTESNLLKPVATEAGEEIYIVDGVAAAQGPNYILAKRLQHWRAIIERSKGHAISSNIAPSTATASVVHNAQFAAAYGGMHLFEPIEVMYQETSNAVMGALLIHDIRNTKAYSYPAFKLNNPLQLFEHGSFHGGVWRCAFKISSIGEMSAVAYYLKTYSLQISAGSAAFGAAVMWLFTGKVGL